MEVRWLRSLVVGIVDISLFNLSFILAYSVSVLIYGPMILQLESYLNLIVFSNFTLLAILGIHGLYRYKRSLFDGEDFYILLKSVGLCYLIITAATFISKSMDYSRLIITNTFIISCAFITLGRTAMNWMVVGYRSRGFDRCNALILGRNAIGDGILKKLEEHPELGYDFAGFVESPDALAGEIKEKGGKTVFVALTDVGREELIDLMVGCENVEFKIVPDLVELISEPLSFDEFRDMPLITIRGRERGLLYSRSVKRGFDVAASALMLFLLSPLFILVSLAVKLDSKGPVFFSQVRVGEGRRHFTLFKFRTMREGSGELSPGIEGLNEVSGLFKMRDDPRVTRVGYFLRRTCIDELPQLVNVLGGSMSLVGPRPHLPSEMKHYSGWRGNRFNVKPGLTGLWQVSGRHELDFDKAVLLDLYYIKHVSFPLDLKILVKTIPSILYSKGRW